jgi:hypothetical protein
MKNKFKDKPAQAQKSLTLLSLSLIRQKCGSVNRKALPYPSIPILRLEIGTGSFFFMKEAEVKVSRKKETNLKYFDPVLF